jgi:tetratricopeptide (TPR) repeat protein
MKHLFKTFLFITIIITSCSKKDVVKLPITTSSTSALEFYNKAMLSFDVGDGPEKRTALDSALALDPNFAMALEMYDSQDPRLRKEHQERAKKMVNKITEAERKMLKIRESYRNGDMDMALESAKWLVDNHGDSYESHLWLGIVQSDRNELDDAITSLKKAIERNEDCYECNQTLMGHHIAAGTQVMLPEERRDVDLGMQYGDELIRIRNDHGAPFHLKANCYRQLGEFEKAKPLYEKSIEKRKGLSSEGTAYIVSGHNYMFGGDLETARERYESAIGLQDESPNGWFSLSWYLTISYIFDNDYVGAIDHISKVESQLDKKGFDDITLLQRKGQVSWQKMICYAHNQMEDEAYFALGQRIKFNKRRADLLKDTNVTREVKSDEQFQTAWVNILFGKYEDAKQNLEELKKTQEERNDPTAMYGYHGLAGMVHIMEGNHEKAIENFNKGDETNIYFNYFKGLALKAAGQEESANKIFKDLAKINFSNWNIAIMRRLANKQLGQT